MIFHRLVRTIGNRLNFVTSSVCRNVCLRVNLRTRPFHYIVLYTCVDKPESYVLRRYGRLHVTILILEYIYRVYFAEDQRGLRTSRRLVDKKATCIYAILETLYQARARIWSTA